MKRLLALFLLFAPLAAAQNTFCAANLPCTANLSAGTLANKYAVASAYRYVDGAGSDSNDGLSPGTAYATPQKCNTVVLALGGGTCDARTLYNYTFSTEIDVGQHAAGAGTSVTLMVPPYGTWTCNVTGAARCLQVFDRGSVVGTTSGQGNLFIIQASATANVTDVCATEPSPGVGGSYLHMEGFGCASATGATVTGAVTHIQKLFDLSRVSDISSSAVSASTKALWIHGICCGATLERMKGIGNNVAGNVPCTLGSNADSNSGESIGPISCTNAGAGLNLVAIVQNNTGSASAKYHDIYTEENNAADTTTAVVGITGASGLADIIEKVSLGFDQVGSTRYLIDIASGSSMLAHNLQLGGVSVNGINDHNAGRGTISPGASAVIVDYSTEAGATSLTGYYTKPSMFGLTNNTGIQLFSSSTTCSTSGVIDNACTTGSITLPVGYSDTNYRLSCTGQGPTALPVVQTYTKSNTTFTITIVALTAAVSTFSSYDCSAWHN